MHFGVFRKQYYVKHRGGKRNKNNNEIIILVTEEDILIKCQNTNKFISQIHKSGNSNFVLIQILY